MPNTVKTFNPDDEKRLRKENIRIMILDLIKVSTLPSVMKRVMEVADDPTTGISDLEKVIENDPAIASRVVAVSNAVFYGFPRKINSIPQAILVLGFEMVKGLAISTTVFNTSHPGSAKWLGAIWAHSFKCAMASVLLARKTGLLTKESAFLAGLLHDIGRPIMVQACGEKYLDSVVKPGLSLEDEEEAFGTNHAEAGAWFADKCKLPDDCVSAIRYHHCLPKSLAGEKPPVLVPVTYLANLIAANEGAPGSGRHDEALKAIGLSAEDLEEVRVEFRELNVSAPPFS